MREVFISVDVETAGHIPSRYALLSIGACLVDAPETTFYVELKPDKFEWLEEAMLVHKLSLERLAEDGVDPMIAMAQFADWIAENRGEGGRPVFVAHNAPFDWMFVSDYFYRYLGRNPFGHSALDMKAYFMGLREVDWRHTSLRDVAAHYGQPQTLTHNALQDAQDQARLFKMMLQERDL